MIVQNAVEQSGIVLKVCSNFQWSKYKYRYFVISFAKSVEKKVANEK